MFKGRKEKKRNFRSLWTVRLNAALRNQESGLSYSKFIAALKKKGVVLDRKILAEIAAKEPEVFRKIVSFVK